MRLTLKVLRAPDDRVPDPRRVSEQELSIGRGSENNWVLPDPNRHLSKRHCTLAMRSGRWSVTDHSTNGTFVNRDIQPVGDGQTRNLRDGDRLRLGLYEIEVRITDEETLHGRHTAWITQAGIDTPSHDPFANDPFGAETTPDSRFVSGPAAGGLDATLPQEVDLDPLLARPPPGSEELEPVRAMSTPTPTPTPTPRWEAPLETVNFTVADPADAARGDLLAAFLRGAGMPDAKPSDPDAVMESLGATFRSLVIGLRDVMITRAQIKSEFRIEQTVMKAQGNNPLKFSADNEDALAALLGIGRRIDMKPADAVASALRDIYTHETAAIAGMRAGMAAVLSRIDPGRIAANAGPGTPTDMPADGKVRAWDMFARLHADIAASAPDDFEGVFGRAFARGYEQALRDES